MLTGYVIEGQCFCPTCGAEDANETDVDDVEVQPIFGRTETLTPFNCAECGCWIRTRITGRREP
tara:strand:+ start:926 stop:1117 length:192 start_codon:yes stop_codon:yes gene_type:complete